MTHDTAAPATLIVYYLNHFDLLWRRTWKHGYEHEGLFYRSYADLEETIILRCLALAQEQGATFLLEQAVSLREFLARHPDTLPAFQQLAQAGRFALLGAGEATIDINMCHGETMARNLLSGLRYMRELFGLTPFAACLADVFGSSAQYPQVVRQCGLAAVRQSDLFPSGCAVLARAGWFHGAGGARHTRLRGLLRPVLL